MKLFAPAIAAAAVLAAPGLASAREVTFETTLANYGGDGAYVVIYVTDKSGAYVGTLWMAGGRSKYYRHLPEWLRASRGRLSEVDGITGASVGAGRTLKISVDLADTIIDGGYEVHVDTAVENMRENPGDVVVPLTSDGNGKPVGGRGYVKSFTYSF
ncbi:hypothetical protein HDIA_3717 [Hartmannibacter diazotrophicus]|uniref:Tat pathway signal protein n=1 Tax=Hartmannibacter diazotrophicus TaxID=1482074 RepID=A0A2C9DAV0_9HYPH|nr:DUF2271 domain-containing protein [Hartmannibacter diazotrophicus]SON57258.1 hypothetical protein HDIA_3717 [Hartmannibacter diazotrophicus]